MAHTPYVRFLREFDSETGMVSVDCKHKVRLQPEPADSGLRIVLGDDVGDENTLPPVDILVERHVGGAWVIIIHPYSGDAVCSVQVEEAKTQVWDCQGDTLTKVDNPDFNENFDGE